MCTGSISSFAGSGREGSSDGVGSKASFNYPLGVTVDQQTGNLFISDRGNHTIRKITPQGTWEDLLLVRDANGIKTGEVSTLAGSPGSAGFADGHGKAARFNSPCGICFDENSQSLVVCDSDNYKLRRVELNGIRLPSLFSLPILLLPAMLAQSLYLADAGKVSTLCEIEQPTFVAVTANQTILVSTGVHVLYKVTHQGSSIHRQDVLNPETKHQHLNQDRRITKWKLLQDLRELKEWMDQSMNAA